VIFEIFSCLRVVEGLSSSEVHAFRVKTNKKAFIFIADTLQHKSDWIKDISRAINDTLKKERSARRVPVTSVVSMKYCKVCIKQFSLFNRKHSCPKCLSQICGSCIQTRSIQTPDQGVVKLGRTCDICFMLDHRDSVLASIEQEE
jgi:hypothetical protein